MPSDLLRHGRRPSGSDEWGAFPGRDALRAQAQRSLPCLLRPLWPTRRADPRLPTLCKYPGSPGTHLLTLLPDC